MKYSVIYLEDAVVCNQVERGIVFEQVAEDMLITESQSHDVDEADIIISCLITTPETFAGRSKALQRERNRRLS